MLSCSNASLYIVLFLHQTTTNKGCDKNFLRCISYYSYIKPQPLDFGFLFLCVVYRTIPTSNHNLIASLIISSALYIVLFLHQTTTGFPAVVIITCCISYYSYIKPQPDSISDNIQCVVYRTIPTSNHNLLWHRGASQKVVYRTIPTSNHNHDGYVDLCYPLYIVLFLHQTTTMMDMSICATRCISYYSYIKPQLISIC